MRLIDADQMAAEESEAYMNASLLIKDNVNSGINYVVHTKIQRLIADTPTVDLVKHAHWTEKYIDGMFLWECSICNTHALISNYCPHCGAKMDEVTE